MREPGPRPSPGPGWRPGQRPHPRAGNFLRKPAASPGLGGTCPRPWTRAGVGKVALGAWVGLGAARVLWFFSPAPSGPSAARPLARGFKPPAWTPVPAARRGPRAAPDGSATFSPGPESWRRAPLGRGTTSRCGRLPCPGAGRWAVPGRGGCGRPSSRGGVGGAASQSLRSCHRPLAAGGRPPARALSAEGGRGSPSAQSPPVGRRRLPGVEAPRTGSRPAVAEAAACRADGSRFLRAGAWAAGACRLSLTSQLEFLLTFQGSKKPFRIGGRN